MGFLWTLEGIRSPFLDAVFGFVTRFGEELVAILVMCLIYWCVSKRTAYGIGISYFISGLAVQGMKIGFRIERPWVLDPSFKPVESAVKAATGYSFPSGHTQGATALFGSIGFSTKKLWLKICCFIMAVLVGFSRMYLGVHTPLDVGVGFGMTLVISFLAVKFLVREGSTVRYNLILMVALLAVTAGIIIFALALFNAGKIEEHYVSDCLKAAGASVGFSVGMFIERSYINFSVRSKSVWMQVLKYIAGIAGVLVIKEGLKLIIGTGLFLDTLRYCLMILWIAVFYPLIIKQVFQTKESEAQA